MPFSAEAANRAVNFFERALVHVDGEWAGKPFTLLAWQRDMLSRLFGTLREDGLRQYRTCYVEIPRKNGKALGVETPVPTPNGWTEHGKLKLGDKVFAPDGCAVMVLGVTDHYQGECFRVEFSDGSHIIAHGNHEWVTERTWFTKRKRGPNNGILPTVTTRELRETLRGGKRGDLIHRIPVAEPLRLPERELYADPYVLGVWLGDGNSASARVTCADREILDRLEARGYPVERWKDSINYLVGRGRFQLQLRNLGVLGNKHIPECYLRASSAQRRDLLRGLMDTDGYVSKAGQCELVLTNPALFADAVELLRSLGYKPTVKEDRAKIGGKDCGPRYRAQFWSFADDPAVLLPRKAVRLKPRPPRRTRAETRQIVAVEPAGEWTVNCIEVEGGLYLAGEGMVTTHNSETAAGIALFLLFADGEEGAQIYGAASDRDQASIVYRVASEMVRRQPVLERRAKRVDSTKRITVPSSASFYRAIPADAGGAHGFNASGVVVDEVHVQPNRDLIDVLNTSTGARRQPLTFYITTAGYDRNSICYELHDYALKVQSGVVKDETFLPIVYSVDESADWRRPETWAVANPSLGVTVKLDYLTREALRAQETPDYENTFRRLHLNQWTRQDTRWLPLAAWDACGGSVDLEALAGRACYGGLDLASTTDLATLCLVFPDGEGSYDVLWHCWIPEATIELRTRRDRVPYATWERAGYVTATEGNVIDYRAIKAKVFEYAEKYRIADLGYDPWNATQLVLELQDEGLTVTPVRQGFASLSAPTKELQKVVLGRRLRHGDNPVARWAADNMVVVTDPAGNLKPAKDKSTEKIDPLVALIVALDRATREENGPSIYEERGIISFG